MKNSLIRRTVSGVLAVAMVFSAYSCGEKKNNDNSGGNSGTQTAQTANEVIKNSYSSIDMDIEIPADYINGMYYIKDTSQVLIMGTKNNGENKLYLTDMDFSGFNEISLDFPEPKNSQSYLRTTVSPDGYIYALLTLIDYGDFKLPDYDDPNFDYENFDFDAMNEAAEYSCTLYKLSPDGQVISENELENISDYSGDSAYDGIYINNIVADANGNIIMAMSGEEDIYLIADENGRINGKISTGNDVNYINGFTNDKDGNIFACGYGNGSSVFTIDMNSKTFKKAEIDLDNLPNMYGMNYIYSGAGDYKFFFSTGTSLYGVSEDDKPVEIINWIDSDINADSVQSVIALDDGDFIAYLNDYQNNTTSFVRLTKRSAEELANQTVITVGMLYNDSSVTSKITEFNKSNTDYRIKISDYSKYDEYDEEKNKMLNSAEKQLKMDIVSGNAPDMIVTYDMSIISEFAKKGIYADLYPYLEKDDELSKDDIMPNVLKACEFKGKLCSIPSSFAVMTFACKSKFFDKENWTLDEMIDTFHENPDMEFANYCNSKEEIFQMLAMSAESFIDYDKLECHFDSDDFKKMLEFANEFPDQSDQINWETATQDEMEEYWNEQETKCMNDKALLGEVSIYELTQYAEAKHVTFNEDITLVGIPSVDAKGGRIVINNTMAILESSPSKDACWEFIKEFFKEDTDERNSRNFTLPSLVSAFNKKAEESMSKPYYIDENGKKVEYDNTYYVNDREVTIPPLTKEEKDFIVDYIKKTDKVYRGYSQEVIDVVTEEVTKYFKGECTSQQAIDKIQSRVDIMINEQA